MKELGIGSRVIHPEYGEGVVCASRYQIYRISFPGKGLMEISKNESLEVVELVTDVDMISISDVKQMMEDILEKHAAVTEVVQMADRWIKGKMILKPYDESLAPKEIPIESFFHKIVMLRDRVRVLEQKINSNNKLNDEEKVEMQQYITRIYGSLTTFNILFKYKEDNFVGQKGEKE